MNPFDFFDKIYCINLPTCGDRYKAVEQQFARVGIANRVERIWANPPPKDFKMSNFAYPPGEFGVCLSQSKALVHAISANANNCLIFEDDVYFTPNAIHDLSKALESLPEEWDILYLGGNPREQLTRVGPHLSKTGYMTGGYAYAINNRAMLKVYDQHLDYFSLPRTQQCIQAAFDHSLGMFSKNNNGFCIDPYVCQTVSGHSIIRNAHRDYINLIDNLWKQYGAKK